MMTRKLHIRRMTASVVATVLAAIVSSTPLAAQTPTALSLTMDDAVKMGVQHAPRVAETQAQEAAAQSSVTALRAVGFPTVNLLSQYQRLNNVTEFSIPDGQ